MSSSSDDSDDSGDLSDYDSDLEAQLLEGPVIQGNDPNLSNILFETFQLCRSMNKLKFNNSNRIHDMMTILQCLKRLAETYEFWSKSPTIKRIHNRTLRILKHHPTRPYHVAFHEVIRDNLQPSVYELFDSMHLHN